MRIENDAELQAYLKANPGLTITESTTFGEIAEASPEKVSTQLISGRKPHKYHAKRTNGYASKKEAQFAAELKLRQRAGEVWFWLEQVKFKLPGGASHRVDFMVFYHDMNWELVECKGKLRRKTKTGYHETELPMGRLKRRQVEALYNVKVTVV